MPRFFRTLITPSISLLTALTIVALCNLPASAERDPIRLTDGPMLGNPTAHSMLVWARTSDAGEFTVHYGLDAERLDQTSKPAMTKIEHDNGLRPKRL
jgi:hypothetical protein